MIFLFQLNTTVLPFFGLKRQPYTSAEFISNGILSPFGNILTGENKCILIPKSDATELELKQVEQIKFNRIKIIKKGII